MVVIGLGFGRGNVVAQTETVVLVEGGFGSGYGGLETKVKDGGLRLREEKERAYEPLWLTWPQQRPRLMGDDRGYDGRGLEKDRG